MLKPISKLIKFIWAIWSLGLFLISLIIVTPIFVAIILIKGSEGGRIGSKFSRAWAYFLFGVFLIKVKVHNREFLDPSKPYIFVCNHNSQLDIPVITIATQHFFKFLAKEELTKIPLLGYIIKNLHLTVDRKSSRGRAESMAKMKQALEAGVSVVIFPEGTRNRTDQPLKSFHDGAFQLALKSGTPIAMLSINNSGKLLPAGEILQFSPGTINCYWGQPIDPAGYQPDHVEAMKRAVRNSMIRYLSNNQ